MFLLLLLFCMTFYKNINITRCISDLKNGLPICGIIKHQISKNSSKKFYFAKTEVQPDILTELKDFKIISTKERKSYGKDDFEIITPCNPLEEEILNLLKFAELTPILICVSELPKSLEKMTVFEAKLKDIESFAEEFMHDLHFVAKAPIALKNGKNSEFFVFKAPLIGKEHYVIKIGTPEKDDSPLVRIHSSCYTGDLLASLRCDCRDQLQDAIKFISENKEYNGGYVLYLMQEGRGIGLANKIEAYRLQQEEGLDTVDSNLAIGFLDDERNFTPAFKMLQFLKIKSICLITNNPKKSEDIAKFGIIVKKIVHTFFKPNTYNADYLDVKKTRMNHSFE